MFQPDAGVIDAERAMTAMRALAGACGAQLQRLAGTGRLGLGGRAVVQPAGR